MIDVIKSIGPELSNEDVRKVLERLLQEEIISIATIQEALKNTRGRSSPSVISSSNQDSVFTYRSTNYYDLSHLTSEELLTVLRALVTNPALDKERIMSVINEVIREIKTQIEQILRQQEELMNSLEQRWSENKMRRGARWKDFVDKIELHPDKIGTLRIMQRLESSGHHLMVFDFNANHKQFFIGTGSIETPLSTHNYVYDDNAATYIMNKYPEDSHDWRGNILSESAKLGAEIMTPELYQLLQSYGSYDSKTYALLHTPPDIRGKNQVIRGCRNAPQYIQQANIDCYGEDIGFRVFITI